MKILKITWFLPLLLFCKAIYAQTDSSATVKSADKWVKSHIWAENLKMQPSPSINNVEFEKQYKANKAMWDKAFQFLGDSKLATLPPGKYTIDGDNVYAMIVLGAPKKLEDAKWESHRKYIDLHYVISGKIKLGVAPVATAKVTEPYDESKDIAHYTAEGKYLIASPKEFFLFFPQDAHRPDIKVDGVDSLKKLVIKIKYKE
jgi:YhcH/YjgK/YiaL family protein